MPEPRRSDVLDDLVTVRDWWRYGTSTFTKAGLVFGHGTDNATDEAAFLILSALSLPIDALAPWLDCRLTHNERAAVAALFQRRIDTRKPASYLTNSAWIQGRHFYVDERVIVPRSFIGELMCRGPAGIRGWRSKQRHTRARTVYRVGLPCDPSRRSVPICHYRRQRSFNRRARRRAPQRC